MNVRNIRFSTLVLLLLRFSEVMSFFLPDRTEDFAKIRIVGGGNVERRHYPWQALLLIKKRGQATGTLTLCGGILISTKWVLTAAHCVEGYSKMRVYFGVWNVTNRIETGREARLAGKVLRHPCYDGSQEKAFSGFNLAMIELKRKVYGFQAACLDGGSRHDWKRLVNEKSLGGCVATGYGVTDTGNDAEILQKVEFSTVSMVTCNTYRNSSRGKNILCASDDKTWGKDTCKGDMGGPLVCPSSKPLCGGYYLAGVTLAGSSRCGEGGKPGIYAAVYPNLAWIRSVMSNFTNSQQAHHCSMSPPSLTKAVTPTGMLLLPELPELPELRLAEIKLPNEEQRDM